MYRCFIKCNVTIHGARHRKKITTNTKKNKCKDERLPKRFIICCTTNESNVYKMRIVRRTRKKKKKEPPSIHIDLYHIPNVWKTECLKWNEWRNEWEREREKKVFKMFWIVIHALIYAIERWHRVVHKYGKKHRLIQTHRHILHTHTHTHHRYTYIQYCDDYVQAGIDM